MNWFAWIFPASMVLMPLGFTLVAGRNPEPRHADVPHRMARLWIATLVALALHVGVMAWVTSDPKDLALLAAAWPSCWSVLAFMLLWFGLAMPALAARQPGWRPLPHPGSSHPVRSASLERRDLSHPVPPGAWRIGWAVFVLCAVAIAWSISAGAPAMLLLGLGFWLGMGVGGSRAALVEAEPMNAAGSPELLQAWASLRRFKAWCFYGLGLLGTVAFTAVAVLTIYAPQAAALSGAVLGTAAGLAGGVFGTMASVRRARVNALLQQLSANE